MPPHGVRRPDRQTTDSLIAWLEGELDRTSTRSPGRPGRCTGSIAPSMPTPIRDLLGLDVDVAVAAAARRVGLRLRQRRRRAGQLAGAAAGVSGRGAQDQRVRRRRPAHRRRQRHLLGAAGSLAGRAPRRPAARHGRRHAREAHVPGRRRVRVPGPAVSHQPERDSRPRGSARARADARRRADSSRVDWRREGSDRAAEESDRHLRRARGLAAARAAHRQGRAARRWSAAFLDATLAALRDQSSAAVHPRLREPVRRRGRAARPVDHRSRARSARRRRAPRRARACSSAGRAAGSPDEERVRAPDSLDARPRGLPPAAVRRRARATC